jgi:putative FmdB family regulatory protein
VPLYEFQCKKCGHRFERIQKFSDPDPKKCPECGGKLERMLHAPAIQFKGAGWYATDYAGKGKSASKEEGAADSSAGKTETSAGAKGESSAGAKAEPSAGEKKGDSGKDSEKKSSKEKK